MNIDSLAPHASGLTPAYQVFARLATILRDPDKGVDAVMEVIRVDTALTAAVVRSSNSAFYGGREPIRTLEEAVNRLGFREIHRLVGAIASRQVQKQRLTVYQVPQEDMWRLSLASALAMEAFAVRRGDDPRYGYTLGLLHTVGLYALDLLLSSVPDLIALPAWGELRAQAEWEREIVGFDHAEASAYLLESWKLPGDLVTAIRHYAKPTRGGGREAYLLHIAAVIGRSRIDPNRPSPRINPEILAGAGVDSDTVGSVVADVITGINDLAGALRA